MKKRLRIKKAKLFLKNNKDIYIKKSKFFNENVAGDSKNPVYGFEVTPPEKVKEFDELECKIFELLSILNKEASQ